MSPDAPFHGPSSNPVPQHLQISCGPGTHGTAFAGPPFAQAASLAWATHSHLLVPSVSPTTIYIFQGFSQILGETFSKLPDPWLTTVYGFICPLCPDLWKEHTPI